jgi:DNA-binding beta-propeller fold protein YncE
MSTSNVHEREEQLDEVLAAYLEAVETGWAPSRQRLLACYPHLADDLTRFFANQDRVESVAAPLRPPSLHAPALPAAAVTVDDAHGATIRQEAGWPIIPGYEILREVGRGGMGVVYLARQLSCDRQVALKMLLTAPQTGPQEQRHRFRAEAHAVARLQHPGVVQLFEVGENEGRPYLVMEYVAGGSLADRLDGTPLPPQEAALVEKLARATHAAHQAEIIHRDLKPANVLLAGGEPKITDFGLAKRLDVAGQTVSGAIVGTPSYMAPEQASSKGKAVGPATDVYGLGAILYELLTGRPPFKGTTPLETVLQVASDDPVPPRALQPKTPRDLETICLNCLHKDAHKRYPTAESLAADLGRFHAGEPIQARPVGIGERTVKWVRRRPGLAALLALVVLGTVAGFALVLWRLRVEEGLHDQAVQAEQREQKQRREAERSLYLVHFARASHEWKNGREDQARHFLSLCPEEPRGWEWNCLYRVCYAVNPVTLKHTQCVSSVAFSPDGTRLASGSLDNTVRVWDARSGQQLLALKGHTDTVTSVAFSPDGTRLASGSDDQTVKVWDARSGQQLLALKGHRGGVAFSPDGTRLATGSRDQTVKVWDARSGQQLLALKGHAGGVTSVAFSPDGTRLASGSWDWTVKVWDARSGQELLNLKGHTKQVQSVAFSPDGTRLASDSGQNTVKVWDARSGQQLLTLKGHTEWVSSVAFSPDGRHLASGSGWFGKPGEVKVWDAQSGQEVLTLKEQGMWGVSSVAFSPDGQRIACADGEAVTVYDGSPLEKPAVAAPQP